MHVWGEFNVLPISLYRYPGVGAVEESVARDSADLSICIVIICFVSFFLVCVVCWGNQKTV